MLNIAIVDDSARDLLFAKNYIIEYICNNHSDIARSCVIDVYSSGEEFLGKFQSNKYALIVLDIFMNTINGIRTAQIIRMRDRNCKIIFLTSSDEFILDGYSVFASGYFIKPIEDNQQKFADTFEYILPDLLDQIQQLNITVKNENISIPYKNIYFIDINFNHHLRINLQDQEIVTNLSYADCQSQVLNDKRFLECHHRVIVNMDYVKSMENEDFILDNGVKVPISQRKRRAAKLKYMQYLANK